MVVETKEERLARGKPVGRDVPYKAMGGLTGFSSLADGYMRHDASGIGSLPPEVLNRPIGKLILELFFFVIKIDSSKVFSVLCSLSEIKRFV